MKLHRGLIGIAAAMAVGGFLAETTPALFAQDMSQDKGQGQSAAARQVPRSMAEVKLSFAPIVKKTAPAVVNVYTQKRVHVNASPFGGDPFFQRFFGGAFGGQAQERIQRSLGSGVLVGSDGAIVTNFHVAGKADSIRVVLADRREYEAKVLLADERTDLAVLKIDAKGEELPVIHLGNADNLEVGDVVLAIGDPFGVGQTVTSGIVSALARTGVGITDYQFFIQTDAAINPGNSGGALIDSDGNLVGINTAIYSRGGGSNGIGFAIPVEMVKFILNAAKQGGKLERPWLGVGGQTVNADIAASLGLDRPVGMLVDQVDQGSAAEEAGLKPGDVILRVENHDVSDAEGLKYRLATKPLGVTVPLIVLRDGEKIEIDLPLKAPPEDVPRNVTTLEGETVFDGVKIGNLSPAFAEELGLPLTERGVVVVGIEQGSYASRLRLFQPGDVIEVVNNIDINKVQDLADLVNDDPPVEVVYKLRRGGRPMVCGFRPPGSLSCRR